MRNLKMLPSKISATKKRLSNSILNDFSLFSLAICGLLLVLMYASRTITMGGEWGIVPLDLPVASLPIRDKGLHSFTDHTKSVIGHETLVVALTTKELIFGDLGAFTVQKDDVRNKFIVPHADGSPQVSLLLTQFEVWSNDRARRKGIRSDGLVIVVPDAQVPIAVIAGVAERLRRSQKFSHVILGGGVI